ncbi:MAG TPA: hydantoinase/oxoprolinase family protein [Gemmatimonadales bacterium]|jgi:probable H4MPT-linked C1 transfer pathway protein|nr:hydantoinase/oxoprolinase family protein [Gemmatimonadales bacterium]
MISMPLIIGWDVGGVNTKAVALDEDGLQPASVPFEFEREAPRLREVLAGCIARFGTGRDAEHAVTMTAELSQFFRTKREGVGFVLDAFAALAEPGRVHVYGTDGRFHSPAAARSAPLLAAASNWRATAELVAELVPDCLMIDIGTTTTDVIPIARGKVRAVGRTDPERLATRELVYTGVVRTPVEAVLPAVPFRGATVGVAAERFALMGDVHLWLGRLAAADYSAPTPDGRPASREFARERLARVICADGEMLDGPDIDAIARAAFEAQRGAVKAGIEAVRARHPCTAVAVTAGVGAFLAGEAAALSGLRAIPLAARIGEAARTAPAAAVGLLLARELGRAR